MADPARARRLAKRITAIVATELEHQVKDPRLAMVTITAASVTADLRDATIYYTVYGDETDAASSAAALASASGVLRSAVGRQTGIKFTPTLTFVPDVVGEQSRHIEDLLVAARASDAAVAARAAGAQFAGEADPYRRPRDADDEPDDDADDEPGEEAGDHAGDRAGDGAGEGTGDGAGEGAGDGTGDGARDGAGDGTGDGAGNQAGDGAGQGAGEHRVPGDGGIPGSGTGLEDGAR